MGQRVVDGVPAARVVEVDDIDRGDARLEKLEVVVFDLATASVVRKARTPWKVFSQVALP